ncbi:MAG: TylF/MycF/NovP-related O-methyltransferase [Chromatiaceae bacterium]
MKSIMKKWLRQIIERSGRVVLRREDWQNAQIELNRHSQTIRALYGLMRETACPTLPPLSDDRLSALGGLRGISVTQGIYLIEMMCKTAHLPGVVCEMGVAQGATSHLLAQELRDGGRDLWLFDSFQGLPAPTEKDELINDIFGLGSMDRYAGAMQCPRSLVEENLRRSGLDLSRSRIVEGFFNEQTPASADLPQRCSFAFVDFDLYQPIQDALDYLDRALDIGGYIAVHDYGFFSSGAQAAVDEFQRKHSRAFELSFPHEIARGMAILKRVDR